MLKIVICDDEESVRRDLRAYVARFAGERGEELRCTEFSSGEELLESYPFGTDIILMDIDMGKPDGVETVRRLREFAPDVCVIFVTGFAQYAVKSYEVRAFGFLVKPVSYALLRSELAAAVKRSLSAGASFMTVKDRERDVSVQINVRKALCFEVRNHDLRIATENGEFTCRGNLNALETGLAADGFLRCHASFMVNPRYIDRVDASELTMANGEKIPISKNRRRDFLRALTDYAGDRL